MATVMMTESRGSSNAKAKRELGWRLRYPSWRQGFAQGLGLAMPGAMFFDAEGRLAAVMSLDVAEGKIQGVSSIVNPDKLRHLGPVADPRALLRERR
jgi:hypothetical protein